MSRIDAIRKKLWTPRDRDDVPPLGTRETLCNWVREGDDSSAPLVDLKRYGELLGLLPDKIVDSLERARLERAGIGPMLKAGLGYEELLASIIVDGTAIASSSAEARLVPALMIPANYLQPGGIPGRTLRVQLRGRVTTLTTAATMTFRWRDGSTDAFTTALTASGGITQDATVQTNTMWEMECHLIVRAVGVAGTVFVMGDADMATAAVTIANQQAKFMGSAGSATPAAVTVDMTANRFFNWTGQWSLATAYSIQCHQMILEALN
jgi:hypothetical protein